MADAVRMKERTERTCVIPADPESPPTLANLLTRDVSRELNLPTAPGFKACLQWTDSLLKVVRQAINQWGSGCGKCCHYRIIDGAHVFKKM